jgi:hypothetical protein
VTRTSPEQRGEADADVLDSLRQLGESTIGELARDTGRTRDQVLGACLRLERAGEARETSDARWGRRFAATRAGVERVGRAA